MSTDPKTTELLDRLRDPRYMHPSRALVEDAACTIERLSDALESITDTLWLLANQNGALTYRAVPAANMAKERAVYIESTDDGKWIKVSAVRFTP